MTNSLNKMAGKNSAERNGTPNRPRSTSKLRPQKLTNSTPPRHIIISNEVNSTEVTRTSPGLIAGYFAGGKWSEPPSPATLPRPPRHWTQLMFSSKCSTFANAKPQQTDIGSQLKVLLNVQA